MIAVTHELLALLMWTKRARKCCNTYEPFLGEVTSVVIFEAQVSDQVLALQMPQRILELHKLNEKVVLGIKIRRGHRTLEVKRQPFLDASHAGPLCQIHK